MEPRFILPLNAESIIQFQRVVWNFFRLNRRDLPWRNTKDPYAITVSELMLQQTQVERVLPKYQQWLFAYPDWLTLAQASLSEVLILWQGLGYNRRAKFLHQLAQKVVAEYESKLPTELSQLMSLPGIGLYTASAICVFAYDQPQIVVETNIRSVYISHFFPDQEKVLDTDLKPLIEQTFDDSRPRDWVNALMDYGAFIKRTKGNPNTRSNQYHKQAPFKGSVRQARGLILRKLATVGSISLAALRAEPSLQAHELQKIVGDLEREELLQVKSDILSLSD